MTVSVGKIVLPAFNLVARGILLFQSGPIDIEQENVSARDRFEVTRQSVAGHVEGLLAGGRVGLEEVPGVNSQGQTRAELLDNLRDALEEALEMNRAEARAAAVGAYEEVSLSP